LNELRTQYLIGFVPTELDGKTHSLEVTVRTPGARIHTRRSYIATRR
jgi:hypothetical protein